MAAAGLKRLHLRRQRVAGDNDELLALQLVHDLVGYLSIGLRRELGPSTDKDEGIQVGFCEEYVGHLLIGEIRLVVGVDRATLDLGPAALACQAVRTLLSGDRVTEPGRTRVDIIRG